MSLLINEWLPTALLGVACCVVLAVDGLNDLTNGNGLALGMPLLSFVFFLVTFLSTKGFFSLLNQPYHNYL